MWCRRKFREYIRKVIRFFLERIGGGGGTIRLHASTNFGVSWQTASMGGVDNYFRIRNVWKTRGLHLSNLTSVPWLVGTLIYFLRLRTRLRWKDVSLAIFPPLDLLVFFWETVYQRVATSLNRIGRMRKGQVDLLKIMEYWTIIVLAYVSAVDWIQVLCFSLFKC